MALFCTSISILTPLKHNDAFDPSFAQSEPCSHAPSGFISWLLVDPCGYCSLSTSAVFLWLQTPFCLRGIDSSEKKSSMEIPVIIRNLFPFLYRRQRCCTGGGGKLLRRIALGAPLFASPGDCIAGNHRAVADPCYSSDTPQMRAWPCVLKVAKLMCCCMLDRYPDNWDIPASKAKWVNSNFIGDRAVIAHKAGVDTS